MNGFIGSIINILFLPFRLIKRLLGFVGEPIKFISEQRKIEQRHQKQRIAFMKQRKKMYKHNDELI